MAPPGSNLPPKALSNGTLSLRFMQNAHRAKQHAQVELAAAEIIDESKWEVSKEVREAWGVEPARASTVGVSYETSYLPFLFPSLPDPSETDLSTLETKTKVRGRRKFGKNGQETIQQESTSTTDPNEPGPSSNAGEQWATGSRKPVTISGSMGTMPRVERDKKQSDGSAFAAHLNGPKRSVKDMLREIHDVGADMRRAPAPTSSALSPKPPPPMPAVVKAAPSGPLPFLKPAGVDAPESQSKQKIADGASPNGREKKKRKKREREQTADGDGDGGKVGGTVMEGARKKSKKAKLAATTPD